MQTGLGVGGPISDGVHRRLGGRHPEISGRSHSPRPLSGCKKSSPAQRSPFMDHDPSPVSAPLVLALGASTVAHTSQGSPSIDVLSPSSDGGGGAVTRAFCF